jgi:hypothetical protein
MGMFDSFYDARDVEWQTKAYACDLEVYRVGDRPNREDWPTTHPSHYQVQVCGGRGPDGRYLAVDSFATVNNDVLTRTDGPRDPGLPLINYSGHLIEDGSGE